MYDYSIIVSAKLLRNVYMCITQYLSLKNKPMLNGKAGVTTVEVNIKFSLYDCTTEAISRYTVCHSTVRCQS